MQLAEFLCVVFTVISVLTGTADAAVTAWTNPSITGASGNGSATPSIAEDKAVGDTGVTIAANASGTKTYAIKSQPTAGKITINGSSGVLSLANSFSFDFETELTYVLVITCTDGGDNAVGTATVTLSITDVNEAPKFGKSQYSLTIPDGSTAGTTLITLAASDEDKPAQTVVYSLDTVSTVWEIDGTSGVIKVKATQKLDQSTTGGYSLVVKAADNHASPKTGTATVWVAVTTCSKASAMVIGTMTMILVVASMIV